MSDPRLDVLTHYLAPTWQSAATADGPHPVAEKLLAAMDEAEESAGIVRVDTNDEALMDALADRIGRAAYPDDGQPVTRLGLKAAILAALREAS